jgi:hypothetical protein
MKKFHTFTALLMLLSSWAHAVPIVAESAAVNMASALTLYPDHKDANKFYFMPNSSHFARDARGLPLFGFTYWGLDKENAEFETNFLSNGGAYMVFTAKLTPDLDQRNAIERFLKENPQSKIAVLPVMESTIGLTSTNADSAPLGILFQEMNFSRAGRAEDEIGFNGILTKVGAKVFKSALQNPMLLKTDYCYKFQGYGPTMDAVIEVKWQRVYDHYRAAFGGRRWFSRVSVVKEVEKLRQDGYVHWEINGGDASDKEYVQEVVEKIVERLFKPELQYVPAGMSHGGGKWSYLSLSYSQTHREELKTEMWSLSQRALVEREMCLPITLKDLGPYLDQVMQNADRN